MGSDKPEIVRIKKVGKRRIYWIRLPRISKVSVRCPICGVKTVIRGLDRYDPEKPWEPWPKVKRGCRHVLDFIYPYDYEDSDDFFIVFGHHPWEVGEEPPPAIGFFRFGR